jgi:cation diffusion facilitator family transporter
LRTSIIPVQKALSSFRHPLNTNYVGESRLIHHGATQHLAWGIGAAAVGIVGNQLVARYKLAVGRRIQSATLIADAKHSWLDALSSAGAMLGLIGVAVGWPWADAVAGLFVTGFICHVGWEVSSDIAHRLLDGVDPTVVTIAETAAGETDGVIHARARPMDRTDAARRGRGLGRGDDHGRRCGPEMRSFSWTARGV